MSMLSFGVYYVRNTVNGHLYVGSTSRTFRSREIDHWAKLRLGVHKSSHLQRAWNKYGADVFEFVIAEIVETPDAVLPCEQKHLDRHFGENCYNARPVAQSNRGWSPSEETRKRMSDANKRRAPCSAETRRKISDGCKGKVRNVWRQESRDKLAQAKRGKPRPASVKAAMRSWSLRRMADPVYFAKNSAMLAANRCKAILANQKTFTGSFISPSGIEYPGVVSLTHFCAAHSLTISAMSQVANGIRPIHKGWTYRAAV